MIFFVCVKLMRGLTLLINGRFIFITSKKKVNPLHKTSMCTKFSPKTHTEKRYSHSKKSWKLVLVLNANASPFKSLHKPRIKH